MNIILMNPNPDVGYGLCEPCTYCRVSEVHFINVTPSSSPLPAGERDGVRGRTFCFMILEKGVY
jgi:hypothetical protein